MTACSTSYTFRPMTASGKSYRPYRCPGEEMLDLPLCQVADTPFYLQDGWYHVGNMVLRQFNHMTTKLYSWNFHSLEVVSCWRDPQLQASENYSNLTKWRSLILKSCWLVSLKRVKKSHIQRDNKKWIWTWLTMKGLRNKVFSHFNLYWDTI